jgi:hypothetical protein
MPLISKDEAAAIAGLHPKTLEQYIKKDPSFCEATGYHKNAMNGRVFFDDQKFRSFIAEMTGDSAIAEAVTITEAVKTPTAIAPRPKKETITRTPKATGPTVHDATGPILADAIGKAFLLPHKILLTPAEAAQISGLSQKAIRAESAKVNGKWKISREYLDKLCGDLFALGVRVE